MISLRQWRARASSDGQLAQAVGRLRRRRSAVVGLVVILTFVLLAWLGPVLLPLEPLKVDLYAVREAPSAEHWLGTDQSGRDVLSRIVHGLRISILVGLGSVSLYLVIGSIIGFVAGYYGGLLDQVLMRIVDALLSIPLLILIIVFIALLGPGLTSVILVIGLLGWPSTARLVRAQVLTLRNADFITAARVVGMRDRGILVSHVLPNVIGPLAVIATFGIGSAIILEASLGFLGLGVRPPTPSLGVMITEARDPVILRELPWAWVPAATVLAAAVLAVNFVGEGLREALDPRSGDAPS
jgi:peptide/nickel transport system permease protein